MAKASLDTQVDFGVSGQAVYVGHHAAGGYRDLGLAQADARGLAYYVDGLFHIPIIVEWFALTLHNQQHPHAEVSAILRHAPPHTHTVTHRKQEESAGQRTIKTMLVMVRFGSSGTACSSLRSFREGWFEPCLCLPFPKYSANFCLICLRLSAMACFLVSMSATVGKSFITRLA